MKTSVNQTLTPERLSCEEYLPYQTSFVRLYHRVIDEPVAIHWHEFYEMQFILAGLGTHLLNGVEHSLLPGTLCLLTPTDFHAITSIPQHPLELFNVIFTEELLSVPVQQLLFRDGREIVTCFSADDFTIMRHDFQQLWTEFQAQHAGYQIALQALLTRIFVSVSRGAPLLPQRNAEMPASTLRPDIHHALMYMQHHFREPLTLEEVARQAALSPNYFSECFHKVIGTSFQRYLQFLRLRFARSLLRSSSLPVTTICFSSGFTSLAHFERTFKHQFELSPRAYQHYCLHKEDAGNVFNE